MLSKFKTLALLSTQEQKFKKVPKIPLARFTHQQNQTSNNNTNSSIKVKLCNFKTQHFKSSYTKKSLLYDNDLLLTDDSFDSQRFQDIPKEDLEKCLTDLLIELKQPIDEETRASIFVQPEEKVLSSLNDSPEELLQLFSPLFLPQNNEQQPKVTRITRKPPKLDALKFLAGIKKPQPLLQPQPQSTSEPTIEYEVVDDESDRDEEESIDPKISLVKIIEKHEQHFPTKTRKSKIVELVQTIAAETKEEISIPLQSPVKSKKLKPITITTHDTPPDTKPEPKKDIPYATNKLKHLKVPTKVVPKTLFDAFPKELPNYSAVNQAYKTKFYERKQWPPENREEGNKMVVPLYQKDFCDFVKSRWNTKTLENISPSSTGGIFQSQCVTLHESCVILNIAFHVLKSKIPMDSPINRVFNFWLSFQTNLVKKVGEQRMVIRTTMHKLPPPRQVKNGKQVENDESTLTPIELGKRRNLVKYIKKMIIPKYPNKQQIPKLPDIIDITEFFEGAQSAQSAQGTQPKGGRKTEENICTKHADTFRKMLVVSVYMLLAFIPTKDNRGSTKEDYWHEEPVKIPKLVNACNFILTLFNMRNHLNPEPDYIKGESVIKPLQAPFDTNDYLHDGKWQSYINNTIINILNDAFVCESLFNYMSEDDIYVMLSPIDETIGNSTQEDYINHINKKDDLLLAFCETRFAGYMIIVVKNYKNRRKSEDSKECLKPKASKRIREEYFVCEGSPLENMMSSEAKKLAEYYKKRKYKHYGQLDDDKKQL